MRSLTGFDIARVEEKYNAKYIGDFPTKLANGNWGYCGAVFYQPNPDVAKGHTHLFGLADFGSTPVIYNASYLEGKDIYAVMDNSGNYVWSRHTHDYREVPGGAIDGGFDYIRVIGNPIVVILTIRDGKLELK